MSTMKATGLEMQLLGGGFAIVRMADRVRLRNGWTGIAQNWTKDGIMVYLDREHRPILPDRLMVLGIEAKDGDIEEVFPRKE